MAQLPLGRGLCRCSLWYMRYMMVVYGFSIWMIAPESPLPWNECELYMPMAQRMWSGDVYWHHCFYHSTLWGSSLLLLSRIVTFAVGLYSKFGSVHSCDWAWTFVSPRYTFCLAVWSVRYVSEHTAQKWAETFLQCLRFGMTNGDSCGFSRDNYVWAPTDILLPCHGICSRCFEGGGILHWEHLPSLESLGWPISELNNWIRPLMMLEHLPEWLKLKGGSFWSPQRSFSLVYQTKLSLDSRTFALPLWLDVSNITQYWGESIENSHS